MDWTAVLDDTGEDDLLVPHLLEAHPTAPRASRFVVTHYHLFDEDESIISDHRLMELSQHVSMPPPKYTLQALYFLSINYILGVGCLGIPYAFASAGFILCSCILITVTLLSYMTVMWVAETGVRYEVVMMADQAEGDSRGTGEQSPLLDQRQRDSTLSAKKHHSNLGLESAVSRYEVIDLVSYYLGSCHKILYQVSLMALMYVGLLAYSQVFCGAIDALIWGAKNPSITGLSQFVFGVMVVPLSCVELDEQVGVQSFMAVIRFVAILIMVGGSVMALFLDVSRSKEDEHPPYFAPEEPDNCQMSYTACFSGFGVAFSTALFSQLFQHSVPGLLRPLRDQPNKIHKAPSVFGASLLTTFSFYLLLGTTAASYFGADTRSSVNLNFAHFLFGLDPKSTPRLVVLLLRLASNIVVMFPALDTVSVFPLIANTLGNNFYAATSPSMLKWIARHLMLQSSWFTFSKDQQHSPSPSIITRRYSDLTLDEKRKVMERASQISTILWRLVAALPPLVGSIWLSDLSFSLLLAGVAGIYVAFYAPALLQLASYRGQDSSTTLLFHGWYSHLVLTYPVVLFATFSLGMVLLQIRDTVMLS